MLILKDKCEVLHFLKGYKSGPFSKLFLGKIKEANKKVVNKKGNIDINYYLQQQTEIGWIDYLKQFSASVNYLTDDPENTELLNKLIQALSEPKLNYTFEDFEKNLDNLIELTQELEQEIYDKLEALTCLECRRLGEAIVAMQASCHTASIVMAASAVEARLHHLISKKNKRLYQQYFKNSALGGLISLFDKNQYKDKKFNGLKKIVPTQHKPLLDLVNIYRVFSAHPIVTKLDYNLSRTILNLSFIFLLDPELKADQKLLKHK